MATLKIAPTLLNSFDFYIGCPESWKVRAYEGLVSTIKRAPFKPTPEQRLDFTALEAGDVSETIDVTPGGATF